MSEVRDSPATDILGGCARLIELSVKSDPRGDLLPIPFEQLPFVPRRAFAVSGVPAGTRRGGHAHRSGVQLLICLQGRVDVLLRVGGGAEHLVLQADGCGLLFEQGVWCQQTYLDPNTVLLALASEPYDPASYVDQLAWR
jgi:dTDP-4-dehydrorhamnose 3,5-epimerase-like enzyme